MKRIYKVYKKTVSIVNETSTAMYENLVSTESGIPKKGFLLESYDNNSDYLQKARKYGHFTGYKN